MCLFSKRRVLLDSIRGLFFKLFYSIKYVLQETLFICKIGCKGRAKLYSIFLKTSGHAYIQHQYSSAPPPQEGRPTCGNPLYETYEDSREKSAWMFLNWQSKLSYLLSNAVCLLSSIITLHFNDSKEVFKYFSTFCRPPHLFLLIISIINCSCFYIEQLLIITLRKITLILIVASMIWLSG